MRQGESCKHSPRDLPLRSRWLTANKKKPELTADQTLAAPKCHVLFFTAMGITMFCYYCHIMEQMLNQLPSSKDGENQTIEWKPSDTSNPEPSSCQRVPPP
ncbi:hypothetical protein CDAR_14951 [Caerostris darwini]|uniref:Uncharacterized protein n=1 Tax=Caerostris darwini TaxID=1538125 RepID=A0AAV4W7C9_9ARAC|nr:hypothetical protein CDAR_14951 [Caerostris darwini]